MFGGNPKLKMVALHPSVVSAEKRNEMTERLTPEGLNERVLRDELHLKEVTLRSCHSKYCLNSLEISTTVAFNSFGTKNLFLSFE